MKLPSFQFYPGDWKKDANLARASLEARGALIEILILAFECEKRGVLQTGGKPWSIDEIAQAIPGDTDKNKNAIGELLALKVLKKNRKNAIFSSRMCKDDKIRKIRREAGLKGGNPNLVKQSVKQNPTPSAAASSSSSDNIVNNTLLLAREKLEQLMRKSAHHQYTSNFLTNQANQFIEKYRNVKIDNLNALVKSWMNNLEKEAAYV